MVSREKNCLQAKDIEINHVKLQKQVNEAPISFTFCPEDLMPYRRLAAAGSQSFAQFLTNRDKSDP
ncbi:MAG: hypothetical protein ACPGWM_08835, partial [Flavobacteriales bacterium]